MFPTELGLYLRLHMALIESFSLIPYENTFWISSIFLYTVVALMKCLAVSDKYFFCVFSSSSVSF